MRRILAFVAVAAMVVVGFAVEGVFAADPPEDGRQTATSRPAATQADSAKDGQDGWPRSSEPGNVTEPCSVNTVHRPGVSIAGKDQIAWSRLGVAATTQVASGLVEISYEDLVLLVKTARRAFSQKLVGRSEEPARYRPPVLEGKTGIVHLTLRRHGAVICESESKEASVLDGAVAAGVLLARIAREKQLRIPAGGSGYGLEFELLGSREYLAEKYTDTFLWSDELLHAFEPAKEGIGVEFRGTRGWTRASEIVTLNYSPDLALQAAETAIGLRHADKIRFAKDIRYFRFGAYHLWQPSSRDLPVVLVRGETLVPPGLGPKMIDAAIDRMGRYLAYRQNSDGWFSHEYLPSSDRYGTGNVATAQMHALAGLAEYAGWAGKADIMDRVVTGIQKTVSFLNPLTVVSVGAEGKPTSADSGLVVFFPGHEDYLENTARFLSAMVEARSDRTEPCSVNTVHRHVSFDDKRAGLVEGLLGCQDADGRLKMQFKPGPEAEAGEDLAAVGWGLLALVQSSAWKSDERLEQALDKALIYYAPRMREGMTPTGGTVLARAFAVGYGLTNDARASDAAFHVLDHLVRRQVTEAACPWPELHGAINAGSPGVVGVDTALYLSALSDGLVLARQIGDKERVQRYEAAIVSAVRFVLQLEVRPAGCFYIRCQRDALGGVRTALWNNRIRVDHCAAALSALIHARTALYGPRQTATSQPNRDRSL